MENSPKISNGAKASFSFILEIIKIVIIALAIVIPIRYFVFQPFFVQGSSMEPNFHNGDYLIIDEISYRVLGDPQRGDVVVFKFPNDPTKRFIKRIVGLPGETIEVKDGKVIIDEDSEKIVLDESIYLPESFKTPDCKPVSLEEGEYFVLGDNRPHSLDSEDWGILPGENIIGKVVFRAWPFAVLAKVEAPGY